MDLGDPRSSLFRERLDRGPVSDHSAKDVTVAPRADQKRVMRDDPAQAGVVLGLGELAERVALPLPVKQGPTLEIEHPGVVRRMRGQPVAGLPISLEPGIGRSQQIATVKSQRERQAVPIRARRTRLFW